MWRTTDLPKIQHERTHILEAKPKHKSTQCLGGVNAAFLEMNLISQYDSMGREL